METKNKFFTKQKIMIILTFLTLLFTVTLNGCSFNKIDYVEKDLKENSKEVTNGKFDWGIAYEGWVYYPNYADNDWLYKIGINGSSKECLDKSSSDIIDINNNWIYYNINNGTAIYKSKTDGSNRTKVVSDAKTDDLYGLKILGNRVYYLNRAEENSIYRAKVDGTEIEKLCSKSYGRIIIYNSWIYYIDRSKNGGIFKMLLNGSKKTRLAESGEIKDFFISNGWIYYNVWNYNDYGNEKIKDYYVHKVKIDGSLNQVAMKNSQKDFYQAGDWLYYNKSDGIYKIKFDGSDEKKVYSSTLTIKNIDNRWIYLGKINEHDNTLFRMRTDGSSNEEQRIK